MRWTGILLNGIAPRVRRVTSADAATIPGPRYVSSCELASVHGRPQFLEALILLTREFLVGRPAHRRAGRYVRRTTRK